MSFNFIHQFRYEELKTRYIERKNYFIDLKKR